jgi:lipopolysaccharide export system permease LptF/LptG-like protein
MTGITPHLRAMAARAFDSWTMDRIVDPLLADIDQEHSDALRKGRIWRSRWILARGFVVFAKTTAICGGMNLIRLRELPVEDRPALNGTLRVSTLAVIAVAALFELLPLYRWPEAWRETHNLMLLVYLVPQALVLAIPIGLTLGILIGLRGQIMSIRSSAVVIVFAACGSLACLVALAWLVPISNYEYRKIFFSVVYDGSLVSKDMNDLTLGELSQRLEPFRPGTALRVEPFSEAALSYTFHMRVALSSATFLLALLALALSRQVVTRRMASLAFFGMCASYYGIMWAGRAAALRETLPAFVGAWLPNIGVALLAVVLLAVPRPLNGGRGVLSVQ